MKPGLQFRLNQQLTLTPQLQQAIRLLQLSQLELEAELRQIAESNPLLEFSEDNPESPDGDDHEVIELPPSSDSTTSSDSVDDGEAPEWSDGDGAGEDPIDFSGGGASSRSGNGVDDEGFEPQSAAPETLQEHLLWQLNLTHMSARDRTIAAVLIDALNPDGYLIEGMESLIGALPPDLRAGKHL